MSKRAYCLYRVSTLGQVEKDDIPMQKQSCREFAQQQGWTIVQEFAEKGVSGFKVSAKDRDTIQEIQRDAALGKFDVLLVYMFDRLGRREDETPFIVEWFVKNDVEVWSAIEGQQRFDSHTDKLMNYIRYWQASGESIKTSIRTKTRLGQIVQEGKFRGGVCPYGYSLVKLGRTGKKGREVNDIVKNEQEAMVVQKMFQMAVEQGHGARLIASELTKNGFYDRNGKPFHFNTVRGILKNITYVGILRSGETYSDIFPELQIVSREDYDRVQEIIRSRAATHEEQIQKAPSRAYGHALLSGNIYCGHCGGRMFASTTKRFRHNASSNERIPTYKCYNRTKGPDFCDSLTTFRAHRIDDAIKDLLKGIFDKTDKLLEKDLIDRRVDTEISTIILQLNNSKRLQRERACELHRLDEQIMESLSGKGIFTPEQLKRRMDTVQNELNELTKSVLEMEGQLEEAKTLVSSIRQEVRNLKKWSEVFFDAPLETQKMIAAQMIERVTVRRGYEVDIQLSISMDQYMNGL